MEFAVKKAENCFSDAENYEYRLALNGAAFLKKLEEGRQDTEEDAPALSSLRIQEGLRRPTFIAVLDNGVQLKGLLERNIIKVGYVPSRATAQRETFERWLTSIE